MKTVKDVTEENLDCFFEQWLFRPGHPVCEIFTRCDDSKKTLGLSIKQVQDTSDGTPVYEIPVLIEIRGSKSLNEGSSQRNKDDKLIYKIGLRKKKITVNFL